LGKKKKKNRRKGPNITRTDSFFQLSYSKHNPLHNADWQAHWQPHAKERESMEAQGMRGE
jgi:hypothetical protein